MQGRIREGQAEHFTFSPALAALNRPIERYGVSSNRLELVFWAKRRRNAMMTTEPVWDLAKRFGSAGTQDAVASGRDKR
jgi:hypothetical protein